MTQKHKLYLAIALVSGSLAAAPVQAKTVEVPDLDINTYGWVNMAAMYGDTGNGSETYIVDNKYASSRLGAKISKEVEDLGVRIGTHVEFEYQHNPSNVVTPDNRSEDGELEERHINLFVAGDFGQVSIGQGSGAADGYTEIDISGTKVAAFSNLGLMGGALPFVAKDGSGNDVKLIQALHNQDFEQRYDRVRYDSPSFGPMTFSVSQGYKDKASGNGSDDVSELAAKVSLPLAGKLVAGVGYSRKDVGGVADKVEVFGGSASWLHTSGFNLTGVYSNQDSSGRTASDFFMVKTGYKTGKHSVAIHHAMGEDRTEYTPAAITDSEVKAYGISYVYAPAKWLDMYASFNNYQLSAKERNYDNVDIAMTGARVKF
ncbi:porin [Marinobacter adhaerens]|uniref:Porin n=1 Tax=Marinobacter adhaerens TaxID=1033846 RepID=A0A851HQH0_9GAMM|nr:MULTISPECIES: porin [Marinobacter]NWN91979.1 porin [Marinobacter adhaerens]